MAMLTRMAYCSRDDAQRSVDFKDGVDVLPAIDRALMTAAENIDQNLHRTFYPFDGVVYFDWPNQGGSGGGQYAWPWRLWFDQYDCTVLTSLAAGGVTISLDQVFLEPVNNPVKLRNFYEYLELDRSSTAAFGAGSTPQHSIAATGTWGAGADADQAAALAAAVTTTGQTSVTVTDGSNLGVGDLLILGFGRGDAPFPSAAGYAGSLAPFQGERILVTDKQPADASVAISGSSGCTTVSDSDQALAVTGTGSLNVGEVVQIDSEQMLLYSAAAGVFTVKRAWNGTTLATHASGTEIYAMRALTVTRAMYGTTAATYSSDAAVFKHRVPSLVKDLAVAETVNQILQEGSGYARTVGAGADAHPAPGADLASKWDECMTAWGRKARTRAV